nr:MAG TPA: hypothetical protein [Caudoviricetes sp.]
MRVAPPVGIDGAEVRRRENAVSANVCKQILVHSPRGFDLRRRIRLCGRSAHCGHPAPKSRLRSGRAGVSSEAYEKGGRQCEEARRGSRSKAG